MEFNLYGCVCVWRLLFEKKNKSKKCSLFLDLVDSDDYDNGDIAVNATLKLIILWNRGWFMVPIKT